jgi:4-diphosphocytidyl-2-C-methyl-D-erythritol kinase
MLVFPNAKINLGLNIISKRPDGYHELITCFYPIPWKEMLEVVHAENQEFSATGISIPDSGSNIIEEAYGLLKHDFPLPTVKIHLHKIIPIGAGLGGGSADAAFALKVFNELFELGLEDEQLMAYAVRLGADCTFFIKNTPMMARGIGEKLLEIQVSLEGKSILMIYPNIHISTKEAYAGIVPGIPKIEIEKVILDHPIEEWRHLLVNDFEKSIFPQHPLLDQIKQQLYAHGAIYASMSGSGSCMYGIFDEIPDIKFDPDFVLWSGKL